MAALVKAQPLPCLWRKNEAVTLAASGICSPLLGNMNTDTGILQAKITFRVVKFLVLPFGAKENSSGSGLSSPGKLQCRWCSKTNTLQVHVKQYTTSAIMHVLTNTGNSKNFQVSQKAVFRGLATALSLKHNPTTLSCFPGISSQNYVKLHKKFGFYVILPNIQHTTVQCVIQKAIVFITFQLHLLNWTPALLGLFFQCSKQRLN